MAFRIWLIRHAEPAPHGDGILGMPGGIGLSGNGHAQAAALGARFATESLDAVYSSPLKRAFDTAAAIAKARGVGVAPDDDFREIDFGDFEGRTYDELRRSHPEISAAWWTRPAEVEFPNGEGFVAFRQRVLAAVDRLTAARSEGRVAVVTHAGVVRTVIAEALTLDPNYLFRIAQDHAAVNRIAYFSDTAVVELLNCRACG